MANIAVLLCLTGLLAAALAHGTNKREEITRGRPLNSVDHRGANTVMGGGLGMLHNHHPHQHPDHNLHPNPHHNPHPQHGGLRRGEMHHGRGGRHGGTQGHRGGQWMHRMTQHHNNNDMAMSLLKASQQVVGRLPSHRMMQTLREELSRYHQMVHQQQMAARRHSQGHPHRGQGHDDQGHRSQGQSGHQWLREMGRGARGPHHALGFRGHGRHHLSNDRRGHGHMSADPHTIRIGRHGAGHNHRGHGTGPSYGVL